MDRMKNPLHFRYTHTRYNREGERIAHNTGTIEGHTAKSVKHFLVRRFKLQTWSPWTCLPNGKHQRTHTCTLERPYRGIITVVPMPIEKETGQPLL